jgi:hypothetical protein
MTVYVKRKKITPLHGTGLVLFENGTGSFGA